MKMLGRLLGLPDEDLDWLVDRGDALIGNTDADFTDFVVDQVDTSAYRLLPFRSPVSLELFEYADGAPRRAPRAPDRRRAHRARCSPPWTATSSTTTSSRTSSR